MQKMTGVNRTEKFLGHNPIILSFFGLKDTTFTFITNLQQLSYIIISVFFLPSPFYKVHKLKVICPI